MAERESAHRRDMNRTMLNTARREARRGQILGFGVVVVVMASATIAALNGAQTFGSIIGSAGLVGLVSVFIVGRKPEK
jgi:uncharacterized membrane protein